jgi:pimeloyl-CoA synthetase
MVHSLPKEPNEMGFHIYNVTIKVDHRIHDNWLEWMKNKHLPAVMNTGCFTRFQFVRLLEMEESDGITYATQYYASDKAGYESYIELYEPALKRAAIEKWGNSFIEFASLMQVVH